MKRETSAGKEIASGSHAMIVLGREVMEQFIAGGLAEMVEGAGTIITADKFSARNSFYQWPKQAVALLLLVCAFGASGEA